MIKKYILILNGLILLNLFSYGLKPVLTAKQLETPPSRIIRTCCSFGADVKVRGIPLKTITDITCISKIGSHSYLGNKLEANGIIYTKLGGFIDLGHLRDQADWTAYLYSLIVSRKDDVRIIQKLGYEGGKKILDIKLPKDISDNDILLLAGKIAFDLSVWHEIATWFGTSYLPFIPERYSSFSIEDNYSNMMGVLIGIEAIKSELPYEEAMTMLIKKKLIQLKAATTEEETYDAMQSVQDVWWTNEAKLPSGKVLKERYLEITPKLKPWLIDDEIKDNDLSMNPKLKNEAQEISLTLTTNQGIPLSDLYRIEFRLNHKFPVKELFPVKIGRNITQKDFDLMMIYVKEDLNNRYSEKDFKQKKKEKQTLRDLKRQMTRESI